MGIMRIFIAIVLPSDVRENLRKDLLEVPGRLVPPENWHFTLQFLQISEVKLIRLKEILSNLNLGSAFSASLKNVGAFPHENSAKLLWVGLNEGTEELTKIANMISEALIKEGFKIDERPYIPHLTFTRFLPPRNISTLIQDIQVKEHSFKVKEIILYQSILNQDSSHYVHLASYPLIH
jgi:2'-5' RNA ligase